MAEREQDYAEWCYQHGLNQDEEQAYLAGGQAELENEGSQAAVVKGALIYTEIAKQPYRDCEFSAGFVEGHPIDTCYLRLFRDGEEEIILLRPDEMAAISYLCSAVLWSKCQAMREVEND